MVSARLCQLAGQYIRCDHGQRGPLAARQGNAECRVANQRNSAARPTRHFDLTHVIEIEVPCLIKLPKDGSTLPCLCAELLVQNALLSGQIERFNGRVFFGSKHKQEQRSIVMQRKPRQHLSSSAKQHIHLFVARAIIFDFERSGNATQGPRKLPLRAECQFANL